MRRSFAGITRRQRGMTLLEIMVVMVVMAILMAVSYPSLRGFNERNKLRATAREGGTANAQGLAITQTTGANTAVKDTVFADGVGVNDANRDAARLLLIGHNPGLEQVLALLHSGQTGDYRGMPPGSVAVLGMPADAALEPGIARLDAFWWP